MEYSDSYKLSIETDKRHIWNRLMHIRKRFVGEAYNELNCYIDRINNLNVGNIRDNEKYTDISELYEVINTEIDRVDTLYFTQNLFFVLLKNYIFRIEEASASKKKKKHYKCRDYYRWTEEPDHETLLNEMRQYWKVFDEMFFNSIDDQYYGIMSQTYDEWIEITEDIDDKLMSDTLETDLKENLDIVKNNIKLLETITDDCTLDFYEKIMDDISRIY